MKKLLTTLSLMAAISLNANILATAGDIEVTTDDIAPFLQQNAMHGAMQMGPEQEKALLDNFIKYKLLAKEAVKSGIKNNAEFKKRLDVAAEGIAFALWQEKEFNKVIVTDSEAKKFYDDNNASFVTPEQINASHILVKTEKEAKDIIAKLSKLKGDKLKEEFAKIAKEKSIDPSAAQNSGDLGFFSKGQMVGEFETAAFGLKDGELSKTPVKTSFGYHVILKNESKKATTIPFESVKEVITNNLKNQNFQKQLDEKAEALFKATNVKYNLDTNTTK